MTVGARGELPGDDRCPAGAEPPACGLYKGGVGGGVLLPHNPFAFLAVPEIAICFPHFRLCCLRVFLLLLAPSSQVADAVAFLPTFARTRRPAFFGPYRHLLGVRAVGWGARFEECMLASASALEFERLLEEDLGSVSASVGDLIAADSGDMAIKSWDFGPSSIYFDPAPLAFSGGHCLIYSISQTRHTTTVWKLVSFLLGVLRTARFGGL